MKPIAAPIPFAGSQLCEVRHVCAFFNSADDEYRVLMPFIRDGFAAGDKAVHIVKSEHRDDHLRRLTVAGIDPAAALRSGQLDVRINTDTYLVDGRFDQDRMLAVFEKLASGSATGGFPLSRIVCHMDWAADDRSHLDTLVEFEARVNDVWRRHDDAVVCVYDLARFSGDVVIDMIRTHPMIIIGGILQENPFYVPPETFLRDYRRRRNEGAERAAAAAVGGRTGGGRLSAAGSMP
ncbi:MAG TPA: MEDS domain-containing protein [Gemmatimonadales bacterium]